MCAPFKTLGRASFFVVVFSLSTEPLGPLEGMTVKPLFINIGLGLNARMLHM